MRTKIQSHFHRTNNNNKTTSRGWWRGVTCWCWSGNMYWLCVLSDSILSLESWYGESGTQEKQTCWSVPCLWLQLRLHTHLLSPATIDSLWLHFNSSLIVTLSRWYYLFDFLCSDIPTCNRESEQRERKKCKGTKSCNSVSKKWKAAKKREVKRETKEVETEKPNWKEKVKQEIERIWTKEKTTFHTVLECMNSETLHPRHDWSTQLEKKGIWMAEAVKSMLQWERQSRDAFYDAMLPSRHRERFGFVKRQSLQGWSKRRTQSFAIKTFAYFLSNRV